MTTNETHRIINAGGVSLFVRIVGARGGAPPLLLVHGGPDWDHSYLLPFASALAGRRQLLLPDLRGCGRSERLGDPARYHVDLAAADLGAVLDHFGAREVDVLGFSFGGRVAMQLAVVEPHRVRALVLASASADADSAGELARLDEYRARVTPSLQHARADLFSADAIDDETRSRALAHLTACLDVYNLDRLPDYRRHVLDRIRFSGEWMHAWRSGVDFGPRLASEAVVAASGVPVLILHGEHDMRCSVAAARRLHAALPKSTLVVLPRVAHMAQIEASRAWCRAIDGFLAVVPSRTS